VIGSFGSPLRTRLVLVALATVLPALATVVYTQSLERDAARARVLDANMALASLVASREGEVVVGARRLLLALSQVPAVQGGDQRCRESLAEVHRHHPEYDAITVVGGDGSPACATLRPEEPPATRDMVRGSSWFNAAVQRRATVVEPPLPGSGTAVVIAEPVLDAVGGVQQVLAATVRLHEIARWAPVQLPHAATIEVFGRTGTILVTNPPDGRSVGTSVAAALLAGAVSGRSATLIEAVGADGARRLFTIAPVHPGLDTGLWAAVGVEPSVALAGAYRLRRQHFRVLTILAIITIVAALVGGEFFVLRQVRSLNAVTSRLAAGDLAARAQLAHGMPGLSEIGEGLNAMAAALDAREHERDRADRDLRVSQSQYRLLFDANPHAIWVYDAETLQVLDVNQTALDRYGYAREEFLELGIADLHPDQEQAAVRMTATTPQRSYSGGWRHRTRGGTIIEVVVRSHALGWHGRPSRLVLVEDVTEQRRLEDRLRQSQKMEALGQLAGGIAHDFNNLLTAIQGYAELLANNLPQGDARKADAEEILRATDRASTLTRQLLAFGRKQILDLRVLRLGEVVSELTPMLQRLVGETIEVSALVADQGFVRADQGQLGQVLVNLVINARDAMPDGGRLTIETGSVYLDETAAAQHRMKKGHYARLSVADTGTGMDAATQSRLFEPFFTTKPKGRGTGLGLATVYGIVKQSGGHVRVSSQVGQGSRFDVFLPAHDAERPAGEASQHGPDTCRSETILLVEDDDLVRTLIEKVLRQHGYLVRAHSSPERALDCVGRDPRIDLLIADMVLPGMDGPALGVEIRNRHPTCPVLFISGHADSGVVGQGIADHHMRFLGKPFTTALLLQTVRDVLKAEAA